MSVSILNKFSFTDKILLILAGFGNLRGYVEVWDTLKKTQIASLQAADSTFLDWAPNGEVFVTATTAPRLRIGNGFKIWHFSGALLHETMWPQGQELLEVGWQKFPEDTFKEPPITNVKVEGIKPSQPEASKQVYQPPNVRLMKEGKLPENGDAIPQPSIPGLPPGYTSQKNGSNSNRQQRKQTRKKPFDKSATNKIQQSKDGETESNSTVPTETSNQSPDERAPVNHFQKTGGPQKPRRGSRPEKNHHISTGDPEKDKKIRNIQKKLYDISKLKVKQIKGEVLLANQVTKIASEATLIKELKALQVSS